MRIIKTALTRPPRMCIYGQHGIGKSTFGANCPKPIFIQTEDGLGSLGCEAFELATSYDQVIEQINYLAHTETGYQTLVIDSLDWLEKLIFQKVCAANNVTDIAALPYGRGYSLATKLWNDFLETLEALLGKKRMMLVFLAHATIKRFEDPERESYDRYQLDIRDRDANLIAEYVDVLGFASFKVATTSKDKGFGQVTVKARSTGERIVNLAEKPAFTAKNRFNLPEVLPLDWKSFAENLKGKIKKGNLSEVKQEQAERREEKSAIAAQIENSNMTVDRIMGQDNVTI